MSASQTLDWIVAAAYLVVLFELGQAARSFPAWVAALLSAERRG